MLLYFGGRTLGDCFAAVDDVNAPAGAHDDAHVVLDEEDTAAKGLWNASDELHEFVAFRIGEPGRRLVQQHEFWVCCQGAGDADAPLFPIGQ